MIADILEVRPELVSAKPAIPPLRQPGDIIQVCHKQDELPDPTIQWLGGQRFKLINNDCRIPDLRRRRYHVVKEGFEFDAASVPRLAWAFISPIDLGVLAVLSHDDLYERGGAIPQKWNYTRYQADVLFYDLMRLEGVGIKRRRLAYRAVRRFGGLWAWQG
jgi:hypothetical protein